MHVLREWIKGVQLRGQQVLVTSLDFNWKPNLQHRHPDDHNQALSPSRLVLTPRILIQLDCAHGSTINTGLDLTELPTLDQLISLVQDRINLWVMERTNRDKKQEEREHRSRQRRASEMIEFDSDAVVEALREAGYTVEKEGAA